MKDVLPKLIGLYVVLALCLIATVVALGQSLGPLELSILVALAIVIGWWRTRRIFRARAALPR